MVAIARWRLSVDAASAMSGEHSSSQMLAILVTQIDVKVWEAVAHRQKQTEPEGNEMET